MAPVKLNAEWKAMWEIYSQLPKLVNNDVHDLRKATNVALAAADSAIPDHDLEESKHTVESLDGTSINVTRFVPASAPSDSNTPQRALVYAFGGGYVAGSVDIWRKSIRDLAHRVETQVFAVNYRLAPEHQAPAGAEDVYSTSKWLQQHAAEFNVDPARVVLYGKSAGGGIAAAASLIARDKGLPHPLAAQLLVYPMLDDRTVSQAGNPLEEYYVWTTHSNDLAWAALLGKKREERIDENIPAYGVPARVKDLSGLPDTYIDVGGIDLFRDEDIEFTQRLATAGNHVEFHLYPGLAHGFDGIPTLKSAQEVHENHKRFIARY